MVSIVVPTYNESENIGPLVAAIDEVLARVDYEIIIVDDDSPDLTWKTAEKLSERFPIRLIRRRGRSGLATAVVEGFECASHRIVLVMDADLQHPPEKIPDMLERLERDSGPDIVVGSRLVESGSFGTFSLRRRIDSTIANLLAHILFKRTRMVRDVQSGFFALRREVVDPDTLQPRGYKILLEILVMGDYREVEEIGYRFREREHGQSNLDIGIILDYLRHLIELKQRQHHSRGGRK